MQTSWLRLPTPGSIQRRHDSEMNLTTQKVSHPPVRPKYGVFAPARAFLETAMARWVVCMKLEWGKRGDRTEQDNKYDLIECRRTSLSQCLRAGYPSNNGLVN